MSEKSVFSQSMAELVGSDLEFIESHLNNDPYGFWARTLIKTAVSYIEAKLFILKL